MSDPRRRDRRSAAETPRRRAAGVTVPTRQDKPRSLGRDAWDDLRRNPVVIVSAVLIVLFVVMAAFPGLFTGEDPKYCVLRTEPATSRQGDAWFGYDTAGLRRLRPHHLRRAGLDRRRPVSPPSS